MSRPRPELKLIVDQNNDPCFGHTAKELTEYMNEDTHFRMSLRGGAVQLHLRKYLDVMKAAGQIFNHAAGNDFLVWRHKYSVAKICECKGAKEEKSGGNIQVEVQKSRITKRTGSRLIDVTQFHILAVCLGPITGDYSEFMFCRSVDLERHPSDPQNKIKPIQIVPYGQKSKTWFYNIEELMNKHGY